MATRAEQKFPFNYIDAGFYPGWGFNNVNKRTTGKGNSYGFNTIQSGRDNLNTIPDISGEATGSPTMGTPADTSASTVTGFNPSLAGAMFSALGLPLGGLPGMALSGLGTALSRSGLPSSLTSQVPGETFGLPVSYNPDPTFGIFGNPSFTAQVPTPPSDVTPEMGMVTGQNPAFTTTNVPGNFGIPGIGFSIGQTPPTGAMTGNPTPGTTNFGEPAAAGAGEGPGGQGFGEGESSAGQPGAPGEGTGDAGPGGGGPGGGGVGGAGDAGDAGPGGPGGDGGPYKAGGFVNIGNPKSQTDDVPAMLQHGEYVVPRSAMARLANKTGGFPQAAQKIKEMILKFSNDGKSSVHFKERG